MLLSLETALPLAGVTLGAPTVLSLCWEIAESAVAFTLPSVPLAIWQAFPLTLPFIQQ